MVYEQRIIPSMQLSDVGDTCWAQCIYEYGDHGGLLLLANHETEGPADSLKFSLDQGACWHNILLEEAIDIQNIRFVHLSWDTW